MKIPSRWIHGGKPPFLGPNFAKTMQMRTVCFLFLQDSSYLNGNLSSYHAQKNVRGPVKDRDIAAQRFLEALIWLHMVLC